MERLDYWHDLHSDMGFLECVWLPTNKVLVPLPSYILLFPHHLRCSRNLLLALASIFVSVSESMNKTDNLDTLSLL